MSIFTRYDGSYMWPQLSEEAENRKRSSSWVGLHTGNVSEHISKEMLDLSIKLMNLERFSIGNCTFCLLTLHSDLVS